MEETMNRYGSKRVERGRGLDPARGNTARVLVVWTLGRYLSGGSKEPKKQESVERPKTN